MITPETIAQSGWTSVSIAPRALGQTSERVSPGYDLLSIRAVATKLRQDAANHPGGELLVLTQLRPAWAIDTPIHMACSSLGRVMKAQSEHNLDKLPELPDHDGAMIVRATDFPTKEEMLDWKRHAINVETGLPFAEDGIKAIGFVSIGREDSSLCIGAVPLDNKRAHTAFHAVLGEQFYVASPTISESSR